MNAATIDGLVYVLLAGAAMGIAGHGDGARWLRLSVLYGSLLLLEPLLIRAFGTTVGQRVLALRVTPLSEQSRLSFPRLVLRYWMKLVLGAVSLFYILFSGRRQALHDRVFRTLVWHVPSGAAVPPAGSWLEQAPSPELPSGRRRFAAFLGWSMVAQVAFLVAAGFVVAALGELLGSGEQALNSPVTEFVVTLGAASVEFWLLGRAVSGRLPGARRQMDAEVAAR